MEVVDCCVWNFSCCNDIWYEALICLLCIWSADCDFLLTQEPRAVNPKHCLAYDRPAFRLCILDADDADDALNLLPKLCRLVG